MEQFLRGWFLGFGSALLLAPLEALLIQHIQIVWLL